MVRIEISSTKNPLVKDLLELHNSKARREQNLMLVEGYHEISLAMQETNAIKMLLYCPELMRPGEQDILEKLPYNCKLICTNQAVLHKLCYREHPDAWLAVFTRINTDLDSFSDRITKQAKYKQSPELLVLLEDVEKPGNIGAILRSLDASAAHGLLACGLRTDLSNPNVIRASKASIFTVPTVETSNEDAWHWLEDRGIDLVATSPAGDSHLWSSNLTGPVVILAGAEKEGLSSFWLDRAKYRVKIPMAGAVNSLNLAQAVTLFLFEALRQRHSE